MPSDKPTWANELIQIIMLDDFVDRRKALDVWVARWVATADVYHPTTSEMEQLFQATWGDRAKMSRRAALAEKLVDAFMRNEIGAVGYYENEQAVGARLMCLLLNPREP